MTSTERTKRWRKRHADTLRVRRRIDARLHKIKCIEYLGGKCIKCGESHPATLDFHHRNPEEKELDLGSANCTRSWDIICAELDKCDLLCANCHRILHYNDTAL